MAKSTEINQVITCPKCGEKIPLTEALLQPLQAGWKKEQDTEWNKKLETVKAEAKKEASEAIGELNDKLKETTQKLQRAQDIERELRRERDKVKEREKELDLEVSRKVDEQTKKVKDELISEHSLKDRQKEAQIDAMRKQIEDLKQKAEQGSQQAQGEALELVLEEVLGSAFPQDAVEPIGKGKRGADVIQKVNAQMGRCCGTILWECKNTAKWQDNWIDKVKTDQRNNKAELAVIATKAIPKEIQSFGIVEDVWITQWSYAIPLALALRAGIIKEDHAKVMNKDRTKMGMLYDYLTSTEFRQRVELIVETFQKMRENQKKEREAIQAMWDKEEKQLGIIISSWMGMYEEIQAVGGAELPDMKMLQLP